MASTYPFSLDVFPGYPYVDFTQYIDASYANSWVTALLALEQTLGVGGASSPLNPLYSQQYNQTFGSVAQRLANVESEAGGSVVIDQSSGDIQPVGSSNQAGNSGKAADAKHVHAGTAYQPGSIYTNAGQLAVGTGNGTYEILAKGSAGTVLTVGGSDSSGLEWAATSSWTSGDVKFTASISVPAGWLAANGQAVSRSYSALMSATTVQFTGTASGTTISGISSSITQFLAQGMVIEGPGLGTTVTIQSVSSTSITVSSAPTSGSQTFTVFPYGNGDGSTTFNVIDMRGRVPVGALGPGGNAQPTYAMGATGGEQTHTLSTSELAPHTHANTLSNPTHTHTISTAITDLTHNHAIYDPAHDHNLYLDNGQTSYELLYTTPNAQTTTIDTIQGQGGGLLNFSWGPAGGVFIQRATTNISVEYGGSNTSASSSASAVAQGTSITNAAAGSGSGHNNMPPFAAGQWLIKT